MKQAITLILFIPPLLFSQIIEDLSKKDTPIKRNIYTKLSLLTGSGSDELLVERVDYPTGNIILNFSVGASYFSKIKEDNNKFLLTYNLGLYYSFTSNNK